LKMWHISNRVTSKNSKREHHVILWDSEHLASH